MGPTVLCVAKIPPDSNLRSVGVARVTPGHIPPHAPKVVAQDDMAMRSGEPDRIAATANAGSLTLFNLRPITPNIGNDLLRAGMEAEVRSVFGAEVNLVTMPAAGEGIKGAGLSARTVYEINQLADGLIVGPGNLFENGGMEIDPGALAALSVPTMLFSVSTGRIFDRGGRLASRTDSMPPDKIAALCHIAQPVLVRDGATQAYLAALGHADARVVGCPTLFVGQGALALPPPDPTFANTVLISIRHPRLMSVPYSVQGRVARDIREIIDHFRGQRMDVRLLCHDYQDLAFAQTFADVPSLYTEDPGRFLGWLQCCRLNITFRLHAFVCCLAIGRHSVPLTYDERGLSLIETLGMSEWSVDFVNSLDTVDDIRQRCDNLSQFEQMADRARLTWDHLHAVMKDGLGHFAQRVTVHRQSRRF